MNSLTDMVKSTFSLLPENIQIFFSVSFSIIFFLVILYMFIIKPISFFGMKYLINKYQTKLLTIIHDQDINDAELKKECLKELITEKKTNLVKCRNRKIGLFFYELVNLSDHRITYTKFKRLYPYLDYLDDDIIINHKKIKYDCWMYKILAFLLFLLMFIFIIISIFLLPSLSGFIGLVFMGILECAGLVMLSSIIRQKEIDEFQNIKSIYHEKLQNILNNK